MKAFPKIFAIGQDYIRDIFKGPVEITEKLDGSQFIFGKVNGELQMRSKGAILYTENPQKMFEAGMDYVKSIEHLLPENMVLYSEYFRVPKHNTLAYDSIPNNHIALFGMSTLGDTFETSHEKLKFGADVLGVDVVPLLYQGKVDSFENFTDIIEKESYLGGPQMEGCVVKNYGLPFLLGGQPIPVMAGKYVSAKFKEVHQNWSKENTARGKFDIWKDSFRTDARWDKAIQHLRDKGELTNSPKDIGSLIKEVQRDIKEEEENTIKDFLYKEFSGEVLRNSTKGLPEYFKEQLAKGAFS